MNTSLSTTLYFSYDMSRVFKRDSFILFTYQGVFCCVCAEYDKRGFLSSDG